SRIDELARIGKTAIKDLEADDIRSLTDTMKNIVKQFEIKNEIRKRTRGRMLAEVIDRSIAELVTSKRMKKLLARTGGKVAEELKVGFLENFFGVKSKHLDTLLESMTNNDAVELKEIIDTALWEGLRNQMSKYQEAIQYVQMAAREIGFGYEEFQRLRNEMVSVTLGGKTFDVSRDMLLSLYMHTKSEDNLVRILKTEELHFLGLIVKNRDAEGETLITLDEIGYAVAKLSEKERAFGDIWNDVNQTILAPGLNEVSRRMEGYEMATDPFYFPIHRKMTVTVSGQATDTTIAVEDFGRYQARIGGTQPIRMVGYTKELLNGIASDSAYFGMAEPLRNVRAVLNNKKFQKAIEAAGLKPEFMSMVTIINRTQKYLTDTSELEQWGQKMLNRYARSVLGLRVSTIGAQIASVPAAQSEVAPRHFAGIITKPESLKKVAAMLIEKSPFFWNRWAGMRMTAELGDMAAAKTAEVMLFGKTSLLEKPLGGLVWGDKKAIALIYLGVKNEMTADAVWGKKAGTQEFEDAVLKRTEYVVRRTQPMWDMLGRSELGGTKRLWERGLLMFRSARERQYNILLRAQARYAKSGKTAADQMELANAWASVLEANALVAAWKNIARMAISYGVTSVLVGLGLAEPDEEDWDEEEKSTALWLLDRGEEILENMVGLAPGGSQMGTAMRGAYNVAIKQKPARWQRLPEDPVIGMMAGSMSNFYEWVDIAAKAHRGEDVSTEMWTAFENTLSRSSEWAGLPFAAIQSQIIWPAERAMKE
ncbi:MAG TPA: hypothetical protein VFI02_10935, partial [Armatimonadota bacterium]|nr:hypothetical protein [Armatimonadota bacterium]